MNDLKEVGEKWEDEIGNEYIVESVEGTVVISESTKVVEDDIEE